jgi:2-polyprenyl-3-methyl-5-hydroxy-6-metoxy-1,4-benzoquinol methylase
MSCQHKVWIRNDPDGGVLGPEWTGIPADYKLCQCGTYCSLLLQVDYADNYWSEKNGHSDMYSQAYNCDLHTENGVSKSRFILDRIASERGTALEIGCAPGRMLYWLKWAARFKYVCAIDPADAIAIDAISAHAADAIFTGMFPDVIAELLKKQTYDYILASDVFEHSTQPTEFLAECARLLKPGGQLFLMLPLADGLPLDSRMFVANEHAYLHSKSNMVAMMRDAGFDRLQTDRWCSGHDTITGFKQ